MVTRGNFIFKTLTKRDGGEFQDNEGKTIKYEPCYILKVDEPTTDGNIDERKFKIPESSNTLVSSVIGLKPYTEVEVVFSVELYAQNAKLVPIEINPV